MGLENRGLLSLRVYQQGNDKEKDVASVCAAVQS